MLVPIRRRRLSPEELRGAARAAADAERWGLGALGRAAALYEAAERAERRLGRRAWLHGLWRRAVRRG